ncbi:hypothetical protein [Costertonia aggregata]|uniref:Uncharacterized protein n=1 Tax=Costertonia aggregata TaxID=343403 RepID=A0A7H9AQA8_9FLAO|nr:hypothetical protein [Costertonia aggregata]QLG45619.1 hypothetical protein HYG79_09760 [Costertonia aggregata]
MELFNRKNICAKFVYFKITTVRSSNLDSTFVKNNIVLKSFGALFFVFLYVLAMLRPVLPMLEYVVNQDYIAEFLCINKEKVKLNCNGKCYLMQRLSEQKEGKKPNVPKITIEEYPIGFVNIPKVAFTLYIYTTPYLATNYKNDYDFLYSDSNFRPPNTLRKFSFKT